MKKITSKQPNKFYNIQDWDLLDGIQLADDKFNEPSKIDVLLGAEVFIEILGKHQQPKYHQCTDHTVLRQAMRRRLLDI